MATEPPRLAPPAAGRPEGGRGRCAGGEAEEAAAQPAFGASPDPAAGPAAGGRRRGLNGCVPLSHQVAGHMYGKDKGGERRRGAGKGEAGGAASPGQPVRGFLPSPPSRLS